MLRENSTSDVTYFQGVLPGASYGYQNVNHTDIVHKRYLAIKLLTASLHVNVRTSAARQLNQQ